MPRNTLGNLHKKQAWRRLFVREWREHRHMTQEQLAERVGITPASLSRIERGLQAYTRGSLEALAEALQCQPADLLTRNPEDPEAPWSIWDNLKPDQQKTAIRVLKALQDLDDEDRAIQEGLRDMRRRQRG